MGGMGHGSGGVMGGVGEWEVLGHGINGGMVTVGTWEGGYMGAVGS